MLANGTYIRFIRGHIPYSHLDALIDLSKPLSEILKLDVSQPINMRNPEDQSQLVLFLVAFLDHYFLYFRPANLMDHTPQQDSGLPNSC